MVSRIVWNDQLMHRELGSTSNGVCNDVRSFLGVGNVQCLHQNLGAAIFLLGIIIVVSLLFEHTILYVRRAIQCPQLKKIVNRIFEELMIMGFISMVIFTLNTSGALKELSFKFDSDLSVSERLHFYEFFHYIVFLTMIYFISIVLLLLFIGTVVPKILWEIKRSDDEIDSSDSEYDSDEERIRDKLDEESSEEEGTVLSTHGRISRNHQRYSQYQRHRFVSGMDLVQGSRAYSLLLKRYEREGWCFRFNLPKQWQLWKSFEILAYNICQNRSGYIYKNRAEMERLFGVKQYIQGRKKTKRVNYAKYHELCTRNLLFHMSHLHFSAFFILLTISVLPVLFPDYDHWIFIGVGAFLLLINIIIFFKVLHILKGIVEDRLHVLSSRDIQQLMHRSNRDDNRHDSTKVSRPRPTLRVVAQSVRLIIRMQMSALCHRQLHFHNDRFWFHSPLFLLRLFHFATIGQAFYLVWFSLVEWQATNRHGGESLTFVMVALPVIALCVITPMTMPSLVLVMSLTGIFVDLNTIDPESGYQPTQNETKTHIRLMRRSYLRSYYTDLEEPMPQPPSPPALTPQMQLKQSQQPDGNQGARKEIINDMPPQSPSSVFLRIYDSETAAVQHNKQQMEYDSPRLPSSFHASPTDRQRRSFYDNRSLNSSPTDRPRRSIFDNRIDEVGLLDGNTGVSDSESGYHDDIGTPPPAPPYGVSHHRRSFETRSYLEQANHPSPRKSSHNFASPQTIAHFKSGANDGAVVDRTTNVQSPPPPKASFKSYCSKYGGYPET